MTIDLPQRSATTDEELVILREFVAPKDLVFKVLTEHEHIKKWNSPKNLDVTYSEGELEVGAKYSYGMQASDGPEFVMVGEFKEIEKPDRLVYTQSRVGVPGPETVISISLKENEGKTTIAFHHTGFPSREYRDGAIQGWNQAFEKLEVHLSSLV